MTEVSIRPKAWVLPLVVERAIELGTPVKKGDILVEFDRDKIDKAIQDTEIENTLSDLALKQAEEELPILEKALPVDLTAAERSKTQADEDLKKFLEIDRSQSERNAQFMVKRSVEFLEYSKEELRQLEKMYRSKDLTEETEEIILRRQRFQVESSEFNLKEAELRRDQVLKVDLPRQEQRVRENAIKQSIDLEKARALLPLNVNQNRRAGQAQVRPRQVGRKTRRPSPRPRRVDRACAADGLVYYGRCERGHWSAAATAPKLHKGGVIAPDEVFITIVAPRPVDIRATVDEKDLSALTQPSRAEGPRHAHFRPRASTAGPAHEHLARPPRGRQVRGRHCRRDRGRQSRHQAGHGLHGQVRTLPQGRRPHRSIHRGLRGRLGGPTTILRLPRPAGEGRQVPQASR